MKSTLSVQIVLVAVVGTSGCRATSEPVSALRPSPTPRAETRRRFEPPADGRLAVDQVRLYVAVKKQAAAHAQKVAAAGSGAAGLAESLVEVAAGEIRAAEKMGREAAEYAWVRDRVSEALGPVEPGPLTAVASLAEGSALVGSRELVRRVAPAQATAAGARSATSPEAKAWNRDILGPFRSEIEGVTHQGS